VPLQLRILLLIIVIVGAAGISLLLYPALLFTIIGMFWRSQGYRPTLQRLAARPLVARLVTAIRPIRDLPPIKLFKLALLLGLAITSMLMGTAIYEVIGQSMGLQVSFMAFCLVVPLVWIVRMLPISLSGVGVGEGAFVFLIGLFAVPADK